MALTKEERNVLETLKLRPNGAPIRHPDMKAAVLTLATRQLVCDPHEIGTALFTRITAEGKEALEMEEAARLLANGPHDHDHL